MKLIGCSCRSCRRGRPHHRTMIRGKQRAHRFKVRQCLRLGKFDQIPTKCAIGYTD